MSMIIVADPRRSPLAGTRAVHFTAHGITAHAPDVLRIADGKADLLALQSRIADGRLVERAAQHLEILLEAQRPLGHAPGAGDLRRREVEMRGTPVVAFAGRGLGR